MSATPARTRRGIFGRELGHGMRVPRGYRLAWYEPARRVGVYFPAPLHWLARLAREFLWRAGLAWRAPARERHDVFEMQRRHHERQRLADEFARGYLSGWQECFEDWVTALERVTGDSWKQ